MPQRKVSPLASGTSGETIGYLSSRFLSGSAFGIGFLGRSGCSAFIATEASVSVFIKLGEFLFLHGLEIQATGGLFRLAELAVAIGIIFTVEATEQLLACLIGGGLLIGVDLAVLVRVESFEQASGFIVFLADLCQEAMGGMDQGEGEEA